MEDKNSLSRFMFYANSEQECLCYEEGCYHCYGSELDETTAEEEQSANLLAHNLIIQEENRKVRYF